MSGQYVLSVDQSTQGTKGLLFDERGILLARADLPHAQMVNHHGWVEHDPEEILKNTLAVCRMVVEKAGVQKNRIRAMGISNQRETVVAWDRSTGKALYPAVVWQCGRARDICKELAAHAEMFHEKTGLVLSPYFPAPKIAWLLRNVKEVAENPYSGFGTIDSWLVNRLTLEHSYKTDYSNASRTGLFNIHTLQWDETLEKLFGVTRDMLPEVCMSDALYGYTDLDGWLEQSIPICGVLGDSHAALLGQSCIRPGEVKATYGTGSSVMMQTGTTCVDSSEGLVTSLAWGMNGIVQYVLEGNLNYTGAVISWLKNSLGLIAADAECESLARSAVAEDQTCFVPAFTGLGAPYWDSAATGLFTGITRTTGKAEMVKACVDCIAYQITDLLKLMEDAASMKLKELRVDGGPTANGYLMQLQSDLADVSVSVPDMQELSGWGAALAAGLSCGLYRTEFLHNMKRRIYDPDMAETQRRQCLAKWESAVRQVRCH